MNAKIFSIVALLVLLVSMITVIAVPAESFCSDTDGSADIWTPGTVTTEKGDEVDDCDGASDNLKEGYCDANNGKFDNIKCSDFGAVCISADGPDYCACSEGTHFDVDQCVPNNDIPEFSAIAGGIALAGAGL
ncbi:MAG: hypothetical protein AABX51_06925, partial [Nanoarchaeota archaeon]